MLPPLPSSYCLMQSGFFPLCEKVVINAAAAVVAALRALLVQQQQQQHQPCVRGTQVEKRRMRGGEGRKDESNSARQR